MDGHRPAALQGPGPTSAAAARSPTGAARPPAATVDWDTDANLLPVMAHEVNNAVTPLRAHAQLLASASRSPSEAASVEAIQALADRLAHLAAEMLDAARLRDGRLRLHPEPVDLQEEARKVVQALVPVAEAEKVWLRLEPMPPCPAIADPVRFQQVLSNLVANAIRCTPAGGRVLVEVRSQASEAVVRVTDTGVGLDPTEARALFDGPRGSQAPRASQGLGLYICRGLVEAHGGRIACASDGPGRGATFAFTVPGA